MPPECLKNKIFKATKSICVLVIHVLFSTKLVIILEKYGREEKLENADTHSK
jgi:hypothetical protein